MISLDFGDEGTANIHWFGNTVPLNNIDNGEVVFGTFQGTDLFLGLLNEPSDTADGDIISHTIEIKIIYQTIKKLDSIFQHNANWDENNPNSGSYIKNKPFGIKNKMLVDMVVISANSDSSGHMGVIRDIILIPEKTYTVEIDGERYVSQALKDEEGLIGI